MMPLSLQDSIGDGSIDSDDSDGNDKCGTANSNTGTTTGHHNDADGGIVFGTSGGSTTTGAGTATNTRGGTDNSTGSDTNSSSGSGTQTELVPTASAPRRPKAPHLDAAFDTGSDAFDNYTASAVIIGQACTPCNITAVLTNVESNAIFTFNSSTTNAGTYNIVCQPVPDGSYSITVVAHNASGSSKPSPALMVEIGKFTGNLSQERTRSTRSN